MQISGNTAQVELGEGIQAKCSLPTPQTEGPAAMPNTGKADVGSLTSMLQARWKGGGEAESAKPEQVRAGQIRKVRITKLDPGSKQIEVELA
jgi:small subunit ribosomal protein S1